ncbi:MAG: DUF512 domain-containing protein [Oscillospiraceae bacterium]|nr:DUF512 domain-containing protein [Oscillospiraceae bacterium]MDD4413859.1 DUF512 domain-containing protein [Oscillospiraceae bacterium]
MGVLISGVEPNSAAAHLGILPGDMLMKINGHDIEDVLDYQFYMTEAELTMSLVRYGKAFSRRLTKQPDEDTGLEFETYLMDRQHSCCNKCIFCFIDQLPKGMRKSLYFKDDDSRLSFLFGNYITLTNLTEHEIERIISMHISPINISVHTTNPALRCKMMNNRFAGESLSVLHRFAQAGIRMHCQLVLCPGINDREELERTMNDLAGLVPMLESVAGVPVGLTKHRMGLTPLRPYSAEEAAAVIRQMKAMGDLMTERHGMRVFYPADEFYLKAKMPLPGDEFYGDYLQLENGVGLITLLKSQFEQALESCTQKPCGSRIILATGIAAAPFIKSLVERAKAEWITLNAEVVPVVNNFFGDTIDVAGLVTGQDLISQLEGKTGDILLIPAVMLRREGDLFLDGISVGQAENSLGMRIIPVQPDGEALMNALLL